MRVVGGTDTGNLPSKRTFACFLQMGEITQFIAKAHGGGGTPDEERLFTVVYEELRRIASAKMAREAEGHTLQPTALVHEAWLRLGGDSQPAWENRAHFFSAATEAMRRILIERTRRKGRLRRGGGNERVDLEEVTIATEDPDEVVLTVNEALERLELKDPEKARIVKMRYFLGMNHQEIADALGIAEPTVRRHWAYARSWLYAELASGSDRGL